MSEKHLFNNLIQKQCHKIQQTLLHELELKTKISITLNN